VKNKELMKKTKEENSPEDVRKKELEHVLDEVEEKGDDIAEHGREQTSYGQHLSDLARATRATVTFLPSNADFESLIGDWSLVNDQALRALKEVQEFHQYWVSGTASTASVTTSGAVNPNVILPYVPAEEQDHAHEAIQNFYRVASRPQLLDDVSALMAQLGFDQGPTGKKSPVELLHTAHQAYSQPVSPSNPVSTSLIPMRECIESVVNELLRRRPKQEKAKKNWSKIESIGRQLKKEEVDPAEIQSWARQYRELVHTILSPAKQADLSREEWEVRLQQATLFLEGFLKGLDPSKFKN
jgi:hypothetical protein